MSNFDHFTRFPKSGVFNPQMNPAQYDKEKTLYSKLATEQINHFGVKCDYILVSYDLQYDRIFGEDNDQRVERKFEINTTFELPKEEEMKMAFMIEGLDKFSIYVTKLHWTARAGGEAKPRTGDFIKTAYNTFLYEITAVYDGEVDNRFLQADHVYELVVKKWKNNHVDDPTDILGVGANGDDIFDDSDIIDDLKDRPDVVPPEFPNTSGKGKPGTLYDQPVEETPPDDFFGGF